MGHASPSTEWLKHVKTHLVDAPIDLPHKATRRLLRGGHAWRKGVGIGALKKKC